MQTLNRRAFFRITKDSPYYTTYRRHGGPPARYLSVAWAEQGNFTICTLKVGHDLFVGVTKRHPKLDKKWKAQDAQFISLARAVEGMAPTKTPQQEVDALSVALSLGHAKLIEA